VTVLSDTEATINVTFYNASDNSQICFNESVANNSQATCTWSGLKSNSSYTWNVTAYDGFSTTLTGLYNFNTSENLMIGTTKDADGNVIGNSQVIIIDQSDDTIAYKTTSNSTGHWSIGIDYAGTYMAVGYNRSNQTISGDAQPHITVS